MKHIVHFEMIGYCEALEKFDQEIDHEQTELIYQQPS
jgi:hypothetical protein